MAALRARDRRRRRARARLGLVHPRPGGRGLRARAGAGARARATRSAVANGTEAIQLALRRAAASGPGDEVVTSPLTAAFTGARDPARGRAPGLRRPRPAHAQRRARGGRRARSRRARRRSCPCTSTATRRTWTRCWSSRARTASRSSRTPARRTARATTGGPVGTLISRASGALSFYPTKNLGALGDGGAVLVNDAARSRARLRRLRNGGQSDRYRHEMLGRQQPARRDAGGDPARRARAPRGAGPSGGARSPRSTSRELAGAGVEPARGAALRARGVPPLRGAPPAARRARRGARRSAAIGTLIHYPIPLHLQPAFAALGGKPATSRSRSEPRARSCRCRSTPS